MSTKKALILVLSSLVAGALLFWFCMTVYTWHAKAVYLDQAIARQQSQPRPTVVAPSVVNSSSTK